MTAFLPPQADIARALRVAGLPETVALLPEYAEATPDLVEAILDEAAKFAAGVLAPLNAPGDAQGCRLHPDGRVTTPDGFADAYRQFVEGGWNGVVFDPAYGGQGLPLVLGTALLEMWQGANMAFGLCPLLTIGSVELLSHHGSEAQKKTWLPRLISGEWTGTMNLTEPQAGSDLAAVRAQAEPAPDLGEGVYRIRGSKIFITHGDHDMSANIVHMVLARLPDAPPGIRGISLFIVPKRVLTDAGELGLANDLAVVSLEHKLGIHASPTCVMSYGDTTGAVGYLVGEPHRGIEYMFTMMNNARLAIGLQGVGIAERASQAALAYARERVQSPDVGAPKEGPVTIVHHPDVRRMLLTMRCLTQASRLICYLTGAQIDLGKRHPDPVARAAAAARAALLTPIAKGWSTECGVTVASLGIQVHGGVGYVEETGAAQHLRDARIAPIYEGTNGIQAIDLIGRKVLRDQGAALSVLIADMRRTVAEVGAVPEADLAALAAPLEAGIALLDRARAVVLARPDPVSSQAAATPLLHLAGLVTGGWLLTQEAALAIADTRAGRGDPARNHACLVRACFFLAQVMPAAAGHLAAIEAGPVSLMALSEDLLGAA